jgi:hypothetical protein
MGHVRGGQAPETARRPARDTNLIKLEIKRRHAERLQGIATAGQKRRAMARPI